jgi:hypothetical protein
MKNQATAGRPRCRRLALALAIPSLAGSLALLSACSREEPKADSGAGAASASAPESVKDTPPGAAGPAAKADDGSVLPVTTQTEGGATQTRLEGLVPDDGHRHAAGETHGAAGATPSGGAPGGAATSGTQARLDVAQPDHDFGTRIEGEVLTHTYDMKSSGPAELIITTAKPTCGCTVSKLEVVGADGARTLYKFGDPIAPGTELKLEAQLDTKNKHNSAASKINISCNDPRQTVTLGLSTRLDTYFNVSPTTIDFGEVSIADTLERTIEVSGKKPGPFLLTQDARGPGPQGLRIELIPVDPTPEGKAERWTAKVTLGPDAREGPVGFPVSLHSDEVVQGAAPGPDGSTPTYGATVMVTARVRGLISYEPQYLSFGLVRPGQIVSRSIKVKSYDPEFTFAEPRIRLVGPNPAKPEFAWASSFSHVLRPSQDNKEFDVELTLDGLPETVDGSFQGRVLIETGHPSKPEVEVLFSGVCRPGVNAASQAVPLPPPQPQTSRQGG